jgi:replicative DNA helicase Mcm
MTDPVVEALRSRFDDFYERYCRELIDDLIVTFPSKRAILIDFANLAKFDPELARELVEKPDLVMEAAQESLRGKMVNVELGDREVHPRFFGQNVNTPLVMDVGAAYVGKMVKLDSLIVKRSEISPKARIDTYKCTYCGEVYKFRAGKDEPTEICMRCRRKTLKHSPEDSIFVNLQKIAVQDPLEKLKGSIPTWQLEVFLEDELVNTVVPGELIELTGILRLRPRRNVRGKLEKNLYAMFLECVSMIPRQKEFSDLAINDEEERQIRELAKDPQIFEKIWKSVAPSIYGYNEIKQAIALQLFGGTPGKTLVDGGPIRSDMHILLIGDPGSAKTRILQSVQRLVPKGIYVSGKSVTGGGMTAVAERDEFSEGGWTLKAGALVLGSGGTVSIDEFDKIGDEDRAALHEALESQTISVAKAGIIATFSAKTAVLAAANPKFGRFDPNQYPASQFDIPTTLLSRFDLIFPIKDTMNQEDDRRIAEHILLQHEAAGAKITDEKTFEQVEMPPLDKELLRKYIAFAKRSITPVLHEEAGNKIKEYYIGLRQLGLKQGTTPITPRDIEGIIRMAEASAKTRLSPVVEPADAELGIQLKEYMLKTLSVDTSGRRDIDIILTGMPKEKVGKINAIIDIVKHLNEQNSNNGAQYRLVIEEAMKKEMDENMAKRYIDDLIKSGDLYVPRPGLLKIASHDND